jgi:hypothetical protein
MLQQTLVISMFQLAHEKEPARTRPPKADKFSAVNQSLPLPPEDCEPSVEPEDFGKGGVEVEFEYVLSSGPEDCELSVDPEVLGRGGVEVENEYDLELRIGGRVGRSGMGHFSLLTVQTVRW